MNIASVNREYGAMKARSSVEFALEELGNNFIHSSENIFSFLYLVFPPLEVEDSKTSIFEL